MRIWYLLKLYLVALVVLLGLDMLWIGVVAKSFYAEQIGFLMAKEPNLMAAGLFYLLFPIGLLIFVILPALKEKKLKIYRAAFMGGLFGFFAYAAYDLTNMATIAHWPLAMTVVDMIWGATISAAVATSSLLVGKRVS